MTEQCLDLQDLLPPRPTSPRRWTHSPARDGRQPVRGRTRAPAVLVKHQILGSKSCQMRKRRRASVDTKTKPPDLGTLLVSRLDDAWLRGGETAMKNAVAPHRGSFPSGQGPPLHVSPDADAVPPSASPPRRHRPPSKRNESRPREINPPRPLPRWLVLRRARMSAAGRVSTAEENSRRSCRRRSCRSCRSSRTWCRCLQRGETSATPRCTPNRRRLTRETCWRVSGKRIGCVFAIL